VVVAEGITVNTDAELLPGCQLNTPESPITLADRLTGKPSQTVFCEGDIDTDDGNETTANVYLAVEEQP